MKKLFLSLILGLVGTACFAGDFYEYFTLNLTDGTCVSYKLDNLKLMFNKGTVDVVVAGETTSYNPEGIVNMIYSTENLTTTGIVTAEDCNNTETSVYTTDGRLVAKGQNVLRTLKPGIYVVKTADKTTKISVK